MEPLRPLKEEVRFVGPPIDALGRLTKFPLRLGNAESLGAMTGEWAFFTPAVLYLHGLFTDAPLIDFIYDHRANIRFYFRKFNRPVFRGLETPSGDADWNFVLWAVDVGYWPAFSDFLVSIMLTSQALGFTGRVGQQELEIADPVALERAVLYRPDLPRLKVTAFGVDSNRYQAAFAVGLNPVLDPPKLTFRPGNLELDVCARALRGGSNPVNAAQDFRKAGRSEPDH